MTFNPKGKQTWHTLKPGFWVGPWQELAEFRPEPEERDPRKWKGGLLFRGVFFFLGFFVSWFCCPVFQGLFVGGFGGYLLVFA